MTTATELINKNMINQLFVSTALIKIHGNEKSNYKAIINHYSLINYVNTILPSLVYFVQIVVFLGGSWRGGKRMT